MLAAAGHAELHMLCKQGSDIVSVPLSKAHNDTSVRCDISGLRHDPRPQASQTTCICRLATVCRALKECRGRTRAFWSIDQINKMGVFLMPSSEIAGFFVFADPGSAGGHRRHHAHGGPGAGVPEAPGRRGIGPPQPAAAAQCARRARGGGFAHGRRHRAQGHAGDASFGRPAR